MNVINSVNSTRVTTDPNTAKKPSNDKSAEKGNEKKVAAEPAENQVTLSKMGQATLSSQDKKVDDAAPSDNLAQAKNSNEGMLQAQSGNITPEFVAALLERNPYQS